MKHLIMGVVLIAGFFGGNVLVEPIEYVQAEEPIKVEWTADKIKEEIREVFPENPEQMIAIAKCESGLKATAINTKNKNKTTDGGIFQINSTHKTDIDKFDPKQNIAFARKLYDERGVKPWSASKHCWSK